MESLLSQKENLTNTLYNIKECGSRFRTTDYLDHEDFGNFSKIIKECVKNIEFDGQPCKVDHQEALKNKVQQLVKDKNRPNSENISLKPQVKQPSAVVDKITITTEDLLQHITSGQPFFAGVRDPEFRCHKSPYY